MAIAMITSLFEIWETVLAVLLLLAISVGIIFVYSPDLIQAKTLNNELSYIASIKGDKDFQIVLNLEKAEDVKLENNKDLSSIKLTVGDKSTTKQYIGTDIEITKENNQILIS